MWIRIWGMAWLLCACALSAASGAEFFAAPNGQPGGDGSIAHPWALPVALSPTGGVVRPGDTIWLRGGAYTGPTNIWTANLNGTSNAPIIVRQYPNERATING